MMFFQNHKIFSPIFRFALGSLLFFGSVLQASRGGQERPQNAEIGIPLKVLVVSTFHLTHKWTSEVNAQLEFGMHGYTPYIEYLGLNAARGRAGNYQQKFLAYLPLIQKKKYDIIVGLLHDATDLIIDNIEAIPQDIPIVLCGYRKVTPEILAKHPNMTGLNVAFNVEETLKKGLKILPNTEEILVITDDLPSGIEANRRTQEFAKTFNRCKLTLVSGEDNTTQQMLEHVYHLPNNSFVIFAPWRNYAKDGFSSLREIGNEIYKSGIPYFVLTDVLFGKGALGGVMAHGPHDGDVLAELVEATARQGSALNVPFRFDECLFSIDMKIFEQYGLNEKLLPPDTVRFNNPESLWDTHPLLCSLVPIAFLVLLALLIVILFYHNRFRNFARRNRKSQAKLIQELTNHKNIKALLQAGMERIISEQESAKVICESMMAQYGKKLGAERVLFLQCVEDTRCNLYFEWCANRKFSVKEQLTTFDFKDAPAIYRRVMERGFWEINDVQQISVDNPTRKFLSRFGIQSAAFVAVKESGVTAGFLCLNYITQKHRFSDNDRTVLVGLCDIVSLARGWDLRRRQAMQSTQLLKTSAENEKIINNFLSELIADENSIAEIAKVLAQLKSSLDCDRVYFGHYEEKGNFVVEHELVSDNAQPLNLKDNVLLAKQLKAWRPVFERKELVVVPDVHQSEYAQIFKHTGCHTVFFTPVHVKDKLVGVVGLGFVATKWTLAQTSNSMLYAISNIISLSFQRNDKIIDLNAAVSDRETIFREVKIPLLLFDQNGDLASYNSACATLLGNGEEMTKTAGIPCHKLFCKLKERPPWCPVSRALETGQTVQMERTFNGRQFLMTANPVLDNNGKIRSIIESAYDITENFQARKLLENAVKTEHAIAKARSYFLATMSHELRTPLNSVIGFTELLLDGEVSEATRGDYLNSIKMASNSLLNLVNDVLDLSKLEVGQMAIDPQVCNLEKELKGLQSMFKFKTEPKGIQFSLNVKGEIPLLMLDRQRLNQVLMNLIGNAVKFTEKGSVSVEVGFTSTQENFGTLTIGVKDTGVGIPEEALSKIFDPFYQADVVRDAHVFKGTGLGLPISNRLIHAMGGEIRVESILGQGSNFTIELKNVEIAQALPTPAPSLPADNIASPRRTVLIVDDVQMNLKVLSAILKKSGSTVVCASSGKEALEVLENLQPDLILTDVWMPEMNGTELAQNIKKITRLQNVPIYAVTADVEAQANFDVKCFNGIVIKPITLERIRQILEA